MNRLSIAAVSIAMAVSIPALGAGHEVVVDLIDGGKIVMQKDGTTYHADAKGKRVRMKDGVVMEGKDGQKYLMKNDAIWKLITEKGKISTTR